MSINERMVAVTRRIANEGIGKTRKNTHQNYNFRGVDEVMNAFAPLLADAGLYLRPAYSERTVVERQGKSGALIYVTVKGDFTFTDDAGETVTVGPFYGEAMDSGDKATNKAMAAAFKYAMFQTFCVPLEGVTGGDADAVTHEVQPVTKILPTAGVWEAQDGEQQAFLMKIAEAVFDLMPDATAALAHIEAAQLDTDEKAALWTRFDSKTRTALKKAHNAQQKEAA